jgi:hypothetical protein
MTAKQIRHAHDLLTKPDNTAAAIASLPGVSHASTYKYIHEVTTGRQAITTASRPGKRQLALRIPCPRPPKVTGRLAAHSRK